MPQLTGEKRDAPDVAGFFLSDDVVEVAAELARSGGRKTLSSKHASAACQLSLIGELAVHARGAVSSASAKLD